MSELWGMAGIGFPASRRTQHDKITFLTQQQMGHAEVSCTRACVKGTAGDEGKKAKRTWARTGEELPDKKVRSEPSESTYVGISDKRAGATQGQRGLKQNARCCTAPSLRLLRFCFSLVAPREPGTSQRVLKGNV